MLSSQKRNLNSDTILTLSFIVVLSSVFNSMILVNQLLNCVSSLRNISLTDVVCLFLDKFFCR